MTLQKHGYNQIEESESAIYLAIWTRCWTSTSPKNIVELVVQHSAITKPGIVNPDNLLI
jgi:hypothetical protein